MRGYLNLSLHILSTKTGTLEKKIVLLTPDEIDKETKATGTLAQTIEARVAAANKLLKDDGYVAMMKSQGAGSKGASIKVGDLEAKLDGGRFKVTGTSGASRLDVDATKWSAKSYKINKDMACAFRAAPTLVAADPAKGILLVEIAQIVETGGDSCNQPSSLKLFPLGSPKAAPAQGSAECDIMECHGLDIHCGLRARGAACDEMYMMGDFCREFATCEMRAGRCALLLDPKFTQCKTCFESCSKGDDEACDTSCRKKMGVP
jgi:hypothetical protein